MTRIAPGSWIGIIGGGQLGRMTAMAAQHMGYHVHTYCPDEDAPAASVSTRTTIAAYEDLVQLEAFAASVDVVTFEFENIPCKTIEKLATLTRVHPSAHVLHTAQNRLREKEFVRSLGIGTAPYTVVKNVEDLKSGIASFGLPCILKTTELGYDGKGQYRITAHTDITELAKETGLDGSISREWILEGFVHYTCEISVIVARNNNGEITCFPVTENRHKNGILDVSLAPATLSATLTQTAKGYAAKIAKALDVVGLIAIEFFVTHEDEILVNEMAPRPHNSGHWTMDACHTSQFEQLVRAICGLPLGEVSLHSQAVMKNLIGDDVRHWETYLTPTAKLHIYGKKEIKPGRKMGHVTEVLPL